MNDEIKTDDRPGQDVSLDVLRLAAKTILARPERDLSSEEAELYDRVCRQLAEEFSRFDQMMCVGAFTPSDWKMDQGASYNAAGIPDSDTLAQLKAVLEERVMQLVIQLEKLGKKTGHRLVLALLEIMKLNGQLTCESVKIATVHNLKPEQVSGGAHKLEVVRDTAVTPDKED